MSESVIADFVGKFNAETTARGEPVTGRIVLSQKRLVLAADGDTRFQIPLSSIFDVAVGHVPPNLGDFFDSTVTVAFEREDRRYVAAVEADDDKIEKFSTVLFKALLNGTEVSLKHPAKRGGLVTDESFLGARLALEPGAVAFRTEHHPVTLELANVIDFARSKTTVGGRSRPTLVVDHVDGGETLTTHVAAPAPRTRSILGRYLRLEYADRIQELSDVDLTADETNLLVAVYSGVETADATLAAVLDEEVAQVARMRNELLDDDLLVDGEGGVELTPEGQVLVSHQFGDASA